MTWGEIDGTPLRLDADDDIHVEVPTAGPHFKVPILTTVYLERASYPISEVTSYGRIFFVSDMQTPYPCSL